MTGTTTPADAAPRRRKQAERSATTREALLDATIDVLVRDGYAQTTTARVCERAGLSRGAHLHHFQTRAALLAAAVQRLATRRMEELSVAAEDLPEGRAGVLAALDLLWSSYGSPLYQGALDLWSHARTDAELRGLLVAVERELDRRTLELARQAFPAAATRTDFEPVVEMAVATIRGLALLDTLHPGGRRGDGQWAYCRLRLADMLGP